MGAFSPFLLRQNSRQAKFTAYLVAYPMGSANQEVSGKLSVPQRAHGRRPLLATKCWLSLGADLMSTHSLGSGTLPGISTTFEANMTSLQTGATFEYRCSPYFILGIRGGLDTPLSQWVGELNSSQAVVEAEAQQAGYVGLVLSGVVPSKKS